MSAAKRNEYVRFIGNGVKMWQGAHCPVDNGFALTETECRCRGVQEKYVRQIYDAHLAARMPGYS